MEAQSILGLTIFMIFISISYFSISQSRFYDSKTIEEVNLLTESNIIPNHREILKKHRAIIPGKVR